MTLSVFLKKILFHCTAVALVLFIFLLLLEYLVPGSVLPFIDLIDGSMVVLGLLVIQIFI